MFVGYTTVVYIIYVYIQTYIYIYIYTRTHTYTHIYIYIYIYINNHTNIVVALEVRADVAAGFKCAGRAGARSGMISS